MGSHNKFKSAKSKREDAYSIANMPTSFKGMKKNPSSGNL